MMISVTGWWFGGGGSVGHRHRRALQSRAQRVCDALEHGLDVRADGGQNADRDDGHQGEDEAILDHGLAVLAVAASRDLRNEVTHDFPPWGVAPFDYTRPRTVGGFRRRWQGCYRRRRPYRA